MAEKYNRRSKFGAFMKHAQSLVHAFLLALFFINIIPAKAESTDLFPFKADELATVFNNIAAQRGIDERMFREKCISSVKFTCQYNAGDPAGLVVSAPDSNSPAELIFIIYAGGGTKMFDGLLLVLDVVMLVSAPGAGDDEREAVLDRLVKKIGDDRKGTAVIHNTEIKAQIVEGIGLTVIISKV